MTLLRLLPLALPFLACPVPALAQSQPFLTTTDLNAFVEGPSCGAAVRFRFVATKAEVLAASNPIPAKMMNAVTQLVRAQCPQVKRVVTNGVVGDLAIYSGFAEAATGWKVRELGAGGGLLGDAGGGQAAGQRELFVRGAGVMTPAQLTALVKANPIFCQRRDAGGTCSGALNMRGLSASGGTVTGRYLVDRDGTTAVGSYEVSFNGSLLCTDPAKARWTVTGGPVSAEMRSDMAGSFAGRMRAAGNPLCIGYARRGGAIINESFGGNGRRLAVASEVTPVAAEPRLRLDR